MKFIINTNAGMVSKGRRFSHFREAAIAAAKKAAMDVLTAFDGVEVTSDNDELNWIGNKYPSSVGFIYFIGHYDAEMLATRANDAFVEALDAFELNLAKTDMEFYERAIDSGELSPEEIEWANNHAVECRAVIKKLDKEHSYASGS